MKLSVVIVVVVLMLCGCGRPTHLEKLSSQLTPGMDIKQVKQLFVGCRLETETNVTYKVRVATKFYVTNKDAVTKLIYGPN